jgi:transcriptional regulator with XRE-family HTH domain
MSEFAKDLGVSKTTVYRAENGKQVFNYKLLFRLVMIGANPDWLLLGRDEPSRYAAHAELFLGKMVKDEPDSLRTVGPGFDRNRLLPIPVKADERLVRLLREVEALYLQSDEQQRDALINLAKSLVSILGRVSMDDPSHRRIRFARRYLKTGMVEEEEGNLEEALGCYEKALERDQTLEEAQRRIDSIRSRLPRSTLESSVVPPKEDTESPDQPPEPPAPQG